MHQEPKKKKKKTIRLMIKLLLSHEIFELNIKNKVIFSL
jgi:hypothetical protein